MFYNIIICLFVYATKYIIFKFNLIETSFALSSLNHFPTYLSDMDKLNFDPSAPTFLERVYEELGNASDHDISIVVWTLSVMGCIMLFFGLVPKTLKGYDDKRDQIKRMQLMKTIDPVKLVMTHE